MTRSEKNQIQLHEQCGGSLVWDGLAPVRVGKACYQVKAILNNGVHIDGHFGKESKRKKR